MVERIENKEQLSVSSLDLVEDAAKRVSAFDDLDEAVSLDPYKILKEKIDMYKKLNVSIPYIVSDEFQQKFLPQIKSLRDDIVNQAEQSGYAKILSPLLEEINDLIVELERTKSIVSTYPRIKKTDQLYIDLEKKYKNSSMKEICSEIDKTEQNKKKLLDTTIPLSQLSPQLDVVVSNHSTLYVLHTILKEKEEKQLTTLHQELANVYKDKSMMEAEEKLYDLMVELDTLEKTSPQTTYTKRQIGSLEKTIAYFTSIIDTKEQKLDKKIAAYNQEIEKGLDYLTGIKGINKLTNRRSNLVLEIRGGKRVSIFENLYNSEYLRREKKILEEMNTLTKGTPYSATVIVENGDRILTYPYLLKLEEKRDALVIKEKGSIDYKRGGVIEQKKIDYLKKQIRDMGIKTNITYEAQYMNIGTFKVSIEKHPFLTPIDQYKTYVVGPEGNKLLENIPLKEALLVSVLIDRCNRMLRSYPESKVRQYYDGKFYLYLTLGGITGIEDVVFTSEELEQKIPTIMNNQKLFNEFVDLLAYSSIDGSLQGSRDSLKEAFVERNEKTR